MAENKQYIVQNQDCGTVQISQDVISGIVAIAVADVDGVAGINGKPGADIAELVGMKSWKGLKVAIQEDDQFTVDCTILVKYGYSVVEVARNVQEAVAAAVESMTNIRPTGVNVNVSGIVRQ